MKKLLYKEFKLATPLLTFLFLGFTVMTFIPGYPILCGVFFVCFGIFQSYQSGREDNDIVYSVLLPVSKTDVVKAKYAAAVILQMTAFILCTIWTIIRMTYLADNRVYKENALMGANIIFLAFVLIIFLAFNVIFVRGFFRTAYNYGKPFVVFIVTNFIIIGLAETLHHIPGMEWMNALDFNYLKRQLVILTAAFVIYMAGTIAAFKDSQNKFEKIDL